MSAIKQWVPDDIETGQEEVATTIEAPPQKGSDSSKTKVTPEATGTDTGTDPGTPEATGTDTGTDPGAPEATGTDTGTDPGAPEATGTDTGTDPGAPEATGTDTGTDPGTPEATEIDIAQMAKKLSEQRKRKRKMTYDQRFKKKNVAIEMELVRLIDAESGGERGEVKRIFNTALRMYYGLPLKGYEDE